MNRHLLPLLILLLPTVCLGADEPLRVYSSGAVGAMVYVTPQGAMGAGESSSFDVGLGAFDGKFYRGKTPLTVNLGPGQYLVSVMPAADYSMRDALIKAGEQVWDGYDYHCVVQRGNNRFRYSQGYLLEKQKGVAAEVLAVFTDQMPDGEAKAYDFGGKSTRYVGTEEAALEQLREARLISAFDEDILEAAAKGNKVMVRNGEDRHIVWAATPERLGIITGHGVGAWAGHRLSVCTGS